MMTTKIASVLFTALTLTAGCAGNHSAMRGSVVMKMSDQQAHVCLGEGEVAVGDHVRLYNNQCSSNGSKRVTCDKVYVAEGTVTEVLNSHYSVVSFPAGTQFAEGETVEKTR
jgi:hypothetical protein